MESGALVLVETLSGHQDRVWGLAWNPSGTILATCGGDKTVRLWAKEGTDIYIFAYSSKSDKAQINTQTDNANTIIRHAEKSKQYFSYKKCIIPVLISADSNSIPSEIDYQFNLKKDNKGSVPIKIQYNVHSKNELNCMYTNIRSLMSQNKRDEISSLLVEKKIDV